jgi:hypothetical protein
VGGGGATVHPVAMRVGNRSNRSPWPRGNFSDSRVGRVDCLTGDRQCWAASVFGRNVARSNVTVRVDWRLGK